MDGVEMIRNERARQISEEGWTAEHDDKHVNGEMARAAACYSRPPLRWPWISDYRVADFPETWDSSWWKPCPDNRIKELVKAGALIAAEIDRLLRLDAMLAEREKE